MSIRAIKPVEKPIPKCPINDPKALVSFEGKLLGCSNQACIFNVGLFSWSSIKPWDRVCLKSPKKQ